MNDKFRQWVTSAAFSISLTSAQIKVILNIQKQSSVSTEDAHPMVPPSLCRRGLVSFGDGCMYLTTAGSLVAGLIQEAGITTQELGMKTYYESRYSTPYKPHPAIALIEAGTPPDEIARRLNIQRESIRKIMFRHRKKTNNSVTED